jgi:adenylylsulfate kinase-like enzyme
MVAAVYCNREPLSWNRENLSGYFEVYVEASLETVIRRDPKGICKGSRAGKYPMWSGSTYRFQNSPHPIF